MPSKHKPILFLREKIAEMIRDGNGLTTPVLGAVSLLILASVLTATVVIGLNKGQHYASRTESGSPQAAVAAKPQTSNSPSSPKVEAVQSAPITSQPQQPKPAVQPQAQTAARPEQPVRQVSLNNPRRPLKGEILTAYGWQLHPMFKDWRFHNGVDISASEGERVSAVWTGEVKEISRDKAAGLTVVVASGAYTVYYGALSAVDVRKGDIIQAGVRIGAVGASEAEPYNHLHLSVKKDDTYIDPVEKFSL